MSEFSLRSVSLGVKHIVWPSVDGRGAEHDVARAERVSPILSTREVRGLWLPSHTRWLEPLHVRASLQHVPGPLGRADNRARNFQRSCPRRGRSVAGSSCLFGRPRLRLARRGRRRSGILQSNAALPSAGGPSTTSLLKVSCHFPVRSYPALR
jgi:hypothetical protein